MVYQKRFKEVVENKHKGWKHIYTDGSKSEIGVGVAATTGSRTESASLLKFSSIFTAETHALHLALNIISATKRNKFTILQTREAAYKHFKSIFRTTQKYENRSTP